MRLEWITALLVFSFGCDTPEDGERASRIAAELGELGVIVDLDSVEVVRGSPEMARAYFESVGDSSKVVGEYWGDWAIRHALSLPNEPSPDVLRKNSARESVRELAGYYRPETTSIVLLQTVPSELPRTG